MIRINYSRRHLFGLKSKYFVSPELFLRLKEIGILKTRRRRAGRKMSSKIQLFLYPGVIIQSLLTIVYVR